MSFLKYSNPFHCHTPNCGRSHPVCCFSWDMSRTYLESTCGKVNTLEKGIADCLKET